MPEATDNDTEFEALIAYLRDHRGFDFTGYKRSTLRRRIGKRLSELGIGTYSEYLTYLEGHKAEHKSLIDCILINVTGFFRDREAWDVIAEKAVPALLERWATKRPVRIWSVGCASGEEAYSIAILMAEALGLERCLDGVRIFATDVDEDALKRARTGSYRESDLADVEPDLRDAYFEKESNGYRVRRDLRKMIVIGRHNIVDDPPISNIDLVICRNLLIYLDVTTQQRVLTRLHYALVPDGFLFLGKTETMLTRSALFEPVDAKHRLFRRDQQLAPSHIPVAWSRPKMTDTAQQVSGELLMSLLSTLPSAHLLLDADDRLLFANAAAISWFRLGRAEFHPAFRDLDVSFRPVELRSVIEEARRERQGVLRDKVVWRDSSGDEKSLRVEAHSIADSAGKHKATVVSFFDISEVAQMRAELTQTIETLETTSEELQSANEELETTNEELQSSNEELETTNEEVQATNEELETTNEELQAANDQLEIINTEFKLRTGELETYKHSMEVLMSGLRMAVIGIDPSSRITFWNAESEDIWGQRAEEVLGHDLFSLDAKLPVAGLRPKIEAVTKGKETWTSEELHATDRRGRPMICRVWLTPTLTPEGEKGGALLLIEDVTQRAETERLARNSQQYARAIFEAVHEPLMLLDSDLDVVNVNRAARRLLELGDDDVGGVAVTELGGGVLGSAAFRHAFARLVPFVSGAEEFTVEQEIANGGKRRLTFTAHKILYGAAADTMILLTIRQGTGTSQST